nr:PTH1-2 [Starmerella bombicola]
MSQSESEPGNSANPVQGESTSNSNTAQVQMPAHSHPVVHHGPIPGMIPLPGGPQEYDTVDGQYIDEEVDEAMLNRYPNDKEEEAMFRTILCPDDIYNEEGRYWADLPLRQRIAFNWNVETTEMKSEFRSFLSMLKKDPLSPMGWYFRNCVVPGAGLLLEGYVLFSVGNIKSLFSNVWPECWSTYEVCTKTWTQSVNYLQVVGIIVGQILVGIIGDAIGRRWGLIQDAVIMFVGLLMLTAMWGTSLNGWVICYAWSLFFYSIGVGGEYPMTATSGMERSRFTQHELKQDRLHRGRRVVSAFSMQGWGQLLNQAFLIILLIIFHHGSGKSPYSKVAVQWTFRVSFAIPAVGTLWLVYFRTYKMPGISKALERSRKDRHVTGYDVTSLKMAARVFGGRLIATCGTWFMNDVLFYGNKIFQGEFLSLIVKSDNKSMKVMLDWLYNLINIGCSMAGYYLATVTIDTRFYGRNWMQQLGFLMDFVLFVVPGFHFKYYLSSAHVKEFQTMYFLSSFFQQFGPNCVTFLVAAEVFPTPIRASAHGLAAASGKLGALLATILYNYIDDQTKFYFVPWFGLAGMVLTLVFMPDVTGLDLREQDRRWRFIMDGRESEYHGVAINPMHLSWWERFRGVGKNYNPEADFKQKVDEMRGEWEDRQRQKFSETELLDDDYEDLEKVSPQIHNYFVKTSPHMSPMFKGDNSSAPDSDDLKLPEAAQNEKQ